MPNLGTPAWVEYQIYAAPWPRLSLGPSYLHAGRSACHLAALQVSSIPATHPTTASVHPTSTATRPDIFNSTLPLRKTATDAAAPPPGLSGQHADDSATMDIDDILREVDPIFDTIPHETRDLQALTRAWVAERCAPELLECASVHTPPLVLYPPKEEAPLGSYWLYRIRSNSCLVADGLSTASLSASTSASRPRSRKSRT